MTRLLPGHVARVVLEGGVSGRVFVGRSFTLTAWKMIDGETCWRAPAAWSAWMSQRRGFEFDLHVQEKRLAFVHDANTPLVGGWDVCLWKPHEIVVPDPRPGREGRLVNVWDPVDPGMDGARFVPSGRFPVDPKDERE